MLDIFPPAKRGSAMAIWGMGVMFGPIMGPTLGAGSPTPIRGAGSFS